MLDITTLRNECIQVCIEADGIRCCCLVSSYHLAESKLPQLRAAITRQATASPA